MSRSKHNVILTQDQLDKQARLDGRIRVVPLKMRDPNNDSVLDYMEDRAGSIARERMDKFLTRRWLDRHPLGLE